MDESGKSRNGEGIAELLVGHFLDVFLVVVDFSGRGEGWCGRCVIRVRLVEGSGGVDRFGRFRLGGKIIMYG